MNTTRKDFLGLAGVFAAAGCTSAPSIKPPRFKPIEIAGLEPKPDWWKCRPDEIIALCEGAKKCSRKEIICHTPLGYPVYALFYGDFSEPAPQTNWSAGQGSTTYRNYYGRAQGGKQTFYFFSGVHGAEPESGVGAANIIQMLETGKDFRGQSDPELLELISKYRFIITPCVNMDGRSISPDHLRGVDWVTFRHASQGTWKADGSRVGWRGSKSWFPLPLDKVSYPGGYPNSEGYNIMHDACPGDLRTAEARAILNVCSRWRVDAALNGHSYESAPSILRPTGIDYPEKLARGLQIRYKCNKALYEKGLYLTKPEPPKPGEKVGRGINLNNLISLASGALALTLECTVSFDCPWQRPGDKRVPKKKYTFEELAAPPAIVLKEYLKDGLEKPFLNRGPETVYQD
ncbi:MAG: hypothetical protein MJ240_10095 [Kiritimatiellae bacterium]|nr:hypothetical protein [Kiritimatiellia bacterium]